MEGKQHFEDCCLNVVKRIKYSRPAKYNLKQTDI